MDLDAYIAAHSAEWDRLEQLLRRSSRLSGAEVDEVVDLYQRTTTHLSVVQSSSRDTMLVSRLTTLVSRARVVVTGARSSPSRDVARFILVAVPLAAYRARWWWAGVALVSVLVATAIGAWVANTPSVQAAIASPEEIRRLVDVEFAQYYSSNPASSFAVHVWTNNAWVAALSIVLGGFLGLPVVYLMWQNVLNVGVSGGLMAAYGRTDLFFGLILPHGMLELTAVFLAAGVGLRLGWTVIDPGRRRRSDALAQEGRSAITVAIGLIFVLFISGVIEAFVTPSGLPTGARIAIGAVAWVTFVTYVLVLGRRADRRGLSADVGDDAATSLSPVSA
jgi:uncharacterized membrane protein SpoIIM required for sporulation